VLDTGPLVALLNRRDRYHRWTAEQWAEVEPPVLTCEAVLTEAWSNGSRTPRCWHSTATSASTVRTDAGSFPHSCRRIS